MKKLIGNIFGGIVGFFVKYPIAILYTVLASLVLAAWLHYNGLRSDLREMRSEAESYRTQLEAQKGATDSAVRRAEELAKDFNDFQLTLDMLEAKDDEIRNETRRIRDRIAGLRLQQTVETDPVLAGDVATGEYGSSRRMLDCASGSTGACGAAGTGSTGTATAAADRIP